MLKKIISGAGFVKNNVFIFVSCATIFLTSCGGGSNNNSDSKNTVPLSDNSINIPMFSESATVYSFGETPVQLNSIYSHTVKNGIVYKTISRIDAGKSLNTSSLLDEAVINKNGVYAHLAPEDNLSYPWQYFVSDDGFKTSLSFYNDANEPGVVLQYITYQTIDVSGKKISDYIYAKFLDSEVNPTSAAALKASINTFPVGAVVFKPTLYMYGEEHYDLSVDEGQVGYDNFESVPNTEMLTETTIFGNVTIKHSIDKRFTYALYNGQVRYASYREKDYDFVLNPGSNYFYNKIAADAVANEQIASCGGSVHTFTDGCL